MPETHGMAPSSPTCVVSDQYGFAHVTSAASLFEAAAQALRWFEITCQSWGTARQLADDELLRVDIGGAEPRRYWVRVGRVREWMLSKVAD